MGDPWIVHRGRYFAERGSFWEGHFWGARGKNFQFLEGNSKIPRFHEKHLTYFAIYTLKVVIYCKNHENIIFCRE